MVPDTNRRLSREESEGGQAVVVFQTEYGSIEGRKIEENLANAASEDRSSKEILPCGCCLLLDPSACLHVSLYAAKRFDMPQR